MQFNLSEWVQSSYITIIIQYATSYLANILGIDMKNGNQLLCTSNKLY